MDVIELHRVLPKVFESERDTDRIARSEIWLKDVVLKRPDHYRVDAESGTGKSSLCSFIYGNRTDYSGTITIDGEDIATFGIGRWIELRRNHLAYLPQEMRLFPELTALENIMLKNRLTDACSGTEIDRMMERLELDGLAERPAGRLSIGQQQRVAVIRAVCQPFDFLMLDEPVSHLDGRNNSAVAALVSERAAANSAAIIATSVGNHLNINTTTTLNL